MTTRLAQFLRSIWFSALRATVSIPACVFVNYRYPLYRKNSSVVLGQRNSSPTLFKCHLFSFTKKKLSTAVGKVVLNPEPKAKWILV